MRISFRSLSVSLSRKLLPRIIRLVRGCGAIGRLHSSLGLAGRR